MVSESAAAVAKSVEESVRLSVLDALRELLKDRRDDAIIELVAKLVARNTELEQRLTEIAEKRRRGEAISTSQLDMFLQALGVDPNEALKQANDNLSAAAPLPPKKDKVPKPPQQPPVRRPPPPELRRVTNFIPVPQEERPCPRCGSLRTCIGHEITEVIDLIPAEVIVRLDKQEKLVCRPCEGEHATAPIGDKVIGGGIYGSNLVAQLVVGKYCDGLPLYRQNEQFERLGFSMPSSSMADQITWATELLRPLWRFSIDMVLCSTVMHLDGTSLPVRDREKKGSTRLGALWGYLGDDVAVYLYTSTGKKIGQRTGEIGPEEMLSLRRGYTVVDASNLFEMSFKRSDLIEVGCNMHSRRYFIKALDGNDQRAALPLAAFKKLYKIEDEIQGRPREDKTRIRQEQSKPVYEELISWCGTYQPAEPPSSPLGRAIRYLLNHRIALTRFLDDGIVPIDNGPVERLHRRTAVTRKAFLFAGSDAGAERAAIAYSILGTCALAEVDPVAYLADILPQLARDGIVIRDVHRLMPAEWKRHARQRALLAPKNSSR